MVSVGKYTNPMDPIWVRQPWISQDIMTRIRIIHMSSQFRPMATPTVGVEDDQALGKTVGEVFVKQFSCILFRKVNMDKDGLSWIFQHDNWWIYM